MDCLKYSNWLENRDIYDLSEADIAMKHAAACPDCKAKLHFDEQLDSLICQAMKNVDMPNSLRAKVDLSLDRVSEKRSKIKYRWYGAFSAVIAAMVVFALSFTFSPSVPGLEEMGRYVAADHFHHDDSVLVVDNPADLGNSGNINVDFKVVRKQLPSSFTFVGARICPIGDCEAVHMVYLDHGKRVSVYMMKTQDVNFSLASGKRYTVRADEQAIDFWKDGNYIYAMIG